MKSALADSRVHVANIGMRWLEEVEWNVALATPFRPPFDMANLSRMTAKIDQTDDEMNMPAESDTSRR